MFSLSQPITRLIGLLSEECQNDELKHNLLILSQVDTSATPSGRRPPPQFRSTAPLLQGGNTATKEACNHVATQVALMRVPGRLEE